VHEAQPLDSICGELGIESEIIGKSDKLKPAGAHGLSSRLKCTSRPQRLQFHGTNHCEGFAPWPIPHLRAMNVRMRHSRTCGPFYVKGDLLAAYCGVLTVSLVYVVSKMPQLM
jgi:hypothetical protein